MDAEKSKELEIKLRKMFVLNKHSQTTKEKSKSDIGNVIRRRKGEQDKRIFRMPKNCDFKI